MPKPESSRTLQPAALATSVQHLPVFERPPSAPVLPARPSTARIVLGFLTNPGATLQRRAAEASMPVVLAVSGSAFALFFLQAGLDRIRVGNADALTIVVLVLIGLLFGTIGVAAVAFIAWLALKILRSDATPGAVVRACALSYSSTLVYVTLGLAANLLLGWRTAVAFGVTGVLWSLGPLSSALRGMAHGRLGVSLVLATLCGLAVLAGWAWLGGLI